MKIYTIKHGKVGKGMDQREIETYLENFIDFYYESSNPQKRENEKAYLELKQKELNYLHKCDSIFMVLDKDLRYIGGYAINIVRPLRYFDVNDYYENYEKIMTILEGNDIEYESDICEITMIWKNKGLNNRDMNKMYAYSLWDAYRTDKKVIIGGAVHPTVTKKYKRVLSNTLYFGDVRNDIVVGLGLVLFQYRKKLFGRLLSALFDLVINSRPVLMLFGKKDVPMRLPNIYDFSSFFSK